MNLASYTQTGGDGTPTPLPGTLPGLSPADQFAAALAVRRVGVGPTTTYGGSQSALPGAQTGAQYGQVQANDRFNYDRKKPGVALLRSSQDRITDFNRLGYDYLEKQAFDAARPRSLSELVSGMSKYDKAAGLEAGSALKGTLRSLSARSGTVENASDPLRRRTALARTALSVQNRNLGIRGALAQRDAAQQAASTYSQQFDSAAADAYGTLAYTDAQQKLSRAAANAQYKANKRSTIGSIIGVAGTVIGGIYGGPAGAAFGGQLGGAVGGS